MLGNRDMIRPERTGCLGLVLGLSGQGMKSGLPQCTNEYDQQVHREI